MKTVNKVLVGLAVVIIILLSSCVEVEVNELECERTNVELTITSKAPEASRNVNRGDVPVWVEAIQVTVSSDVTTEDIFQEFNLVDDGSGVDSFIVEDVPLGGNEFLATTTTSTVSRHESLLLNKNSDVSDAIQSEVDENPYVIYNGSTSQNIVSGGNNVEISMVTEFGRRITVIELEDGLESDYYFEVTTSYNGSDIDTKEAKNGKKVLVYWSGDDSVAGETQEHSVSVYKKSNDALVNSFVMTEVIEASTSISSKWTIYADTILNEEQGLGFVWQDWNEVIIGN